MRLTNAETRALDSMGHRWWRLAGMDEAIARRRLYRLGEDRYRDRLMLAWARAGRGVDPLHFGNSRPCRSAGAPEIPAEGGGFHRARHYPGPAARTGAGAGRRRWLAADFPLEEEAVEAIADQAVARFSRDNRL